MPPVWLSKGPGHYVSRDAANPAVWRFRNLKDGTYLYSADQGEKENIVRTPKRTWPLEGPAYYLAP